MHKTSPPPQPGTVLKNLYMKPSKISTANLAKQFNVSSKTISDIINNRARNLSVKEVKEMLNFDLSATRAGTELIGIGEKKVKKIFS